MPLPDLEPVMISAIEHWSYCPRQCGLIHVESVFDENLFTIRGTRRHERADERSVRAERGKRVERALPIWSDRYGMVGRADIVEVDGGGIPMPVEYKSGRETGSRHAFLQAAAQAICLEEMFGVAVPKIAVYFAESRRRVEDSTADFREEVLRIVELIREMQGNGSLPPPVADKRCRHCSLIDACSPFAMVAAHRSRSGSLFVPAAEADLP